MKKLRFSSLRAAPAVTAAALRIAAHPAQSTPAASPGVARTGKLDPTERIICLDASLAAPDAALAATYAARLASAREESGNSLDELIISRDIITGASYRSVDDGDQAPIFCAAYRHAC